MSHYLQCPDCGTFLNPGQMHSALEPVLHQVIPIVVERLSNEDEGRPVIQPKVGRS